MMCDVIGVGGGGKESDPRHPKDFNVEKEERETCDRRDFAAPTVSSISFRKSSD